MKKIIILILLIFLSGCNYMELNDMGIVSLMAIKYVNNNYELTIEIKENLNSDKATSTIHKAKNSSIEKAMQDLDLTTDKKLYFIDLNVLLIDKNAANIKLTSIIDYLTRDVNFGTNFNIIIDENIDNTIDTIKDKNKIVGDYLKNIIDNKSNTIATLKYDDFLKIYLNKYRDIIIPKGQIENDEYLIKKAYLFNDKTIVKEIDFEDIQIYNLLSNINSSYYFKIKYNDKTLVYKVKSHDVKLCYDDKLKVRIKLNGSFTEVEDLDLLKEDELAKILDILEDNIINEVSDFIKLLLSLDSDILGFKKIYFNNKRTTIQSIKDLDYLINLDLKLDREGLIFEAIGDVYEKDK